MRFVLLFLSFAMLWGCGGDSSSDGGGTTGGTEDTLCTAMCAEDPAAFMSLFGSEFKFSELATEDCPDPSQACGCSLFTEQFAEQLECVCYDEDDPEGQGAGVEYDGKMCSVFLRLVHFRDTQLVSAKTVDSAGTAWTNQCSGDGNNIALAFNLRSTDRMDEDNDLQIRPGDLLGFNQVEIGKTISASDFSLSLSCLESHDGSALASNDCSGGNASPDAALAAENALEFADNLQGKGRGTPVGVAILIDQSGSTSGAVDTSTVNGLPSCLEGKPGESQAGNPGLCRSDYPNLRLSAANQIIEALNPNDPAILFAQNEEEFQVVCNLSAEETQSAKLEKCYSSDREMTLGSETVQPAINALMGMGNGRSNLWSAINKTYAYMKAKPEVAKHIVVIADGPDTCSPSSNDFQQCFSEEIDPAFPTTYSLQSGCVDAKGYGEVRSSIEQANDSNVHVSFIHFQSKGYPQMDPRMQEIACLTGGHYVFLNFNQFSENSGARKEAMESAAERIRNTFGGYWKLVINSDAGKAASAGTVHALSGNLSIDNAGFKSSKVSIDFGVDGAMDTRLLLRKGCSGNSDCAGNGEEACAVQCEDETRTCAAPAPGKACGDSAICCGGTCQEGLSQCESSDAEPLACP